MLVYILGLIVLNFKNRFAAVYSFLNANCTYLENKMELDSNLGFQVGANCTNLGKKIGSHILPQNFVLMPVALTLKAKEKQALCSYFEKVKVAKTKNDAAKGEEATCPYVKFP